jgi:hypothetical protein
MKAWPSLPDNHRTYAKSKEVWVMKKKLLLLAIVGALLLGAAPVLADDGFYVVAVGGGVGTKITSLPYTIKSPGFYYVTGNLACASGDGITVTSQGVTIDLMGFGLSGNSASTGIILGIGGEYVEIRNGTLTGWDKGISANGGGGIRVLNVRASSNQTYGIYLGGGPHLVKGCEVSYGSNGIYVSSGTVSGNRVTTTNGIASGGIISGNYAGGVSVGTGINAFGGAIVSGNLVINFATCISCQGEASVIGNSVKCFSAQTGISLPSDPSKPILMDQNIVAGDGTHYSGGGSNVVWAGSREASASSWGNNAGHP